MSHKWNPIVVLALALTATAVLADEPAAKPDPRLDQKVAYEAKALPVRQILAELSEKTGVEMRAGSNSKDWQVRDRRMNLFVKEVPLGDLQKSIAMLMRFRWSRGGEEGKWYYRLWQDRKSLAEEEAKRQKAEEARAQEQRRRRKEMFDTFTDLASLTPEELEKLKQENPYLYVAAKSGVAKGLGQFFRNAPGAMDAVMGGQEARMRVGELPAAAQQGLRDSLQGVMRLMPERQTSSIEKLMDNLANATIEFNSSQRFTAGSPIAGMVLGDMSVRSEGGGRFDLPFFDPNSNMAKVMGQMATKLMEGVDPEQAASGLQGQMIAAVTADMARVATQADQEDPQPADPELDKKISLKIAPGMKLEQSLEEFSKASAASVMSDQYSGMTFGVTQIEEKEITIRDALDKLAKGYNCSWKKDGGIIRIQDKDWYRKRAAQIPDEWIEAWTKTLTTTGTLDIEDLASIASLTDEQINLNFRTGSSEIRTMGGAVTSSRDLLKSYHSLDAAQKAALASDAGLSAHLLTSDQWSSLEKQIRSKNSALLPDPPIPLIIRMTRRAEDKRFIYTFTVSSPQSDQTVSWEVRTPQYTPPVEAGQSDEKGKKE